MKRYQSPASFGFAMRKSGSLAIGGAMVLSIVVSVTVKADPVEDFYRDKSIDIYIGYSVGGGYDTYARLVTSFMSRHMPGHPEFLPRIRRAIDHRRLSSKLGTMDDEEFGHVRIGFDRLYK